MLQSIAPFLIVRKLESSLGFYREQLGFQCECLYPEEDPFFGMVRRDQVSILLKEIDEQTLPLPNPSRHPWARWDAFVLTEPDALFAEFNGRNVKFAQSLKDTEDGLRGFEVTDLDGYVIFFGKPV